jgi:tetratricopeptide (TPR) repeat protein
MILQGVPAKELLLLAEGVARGRFAFASGRYDEAARQYRAAIAIEAKVPYQEPSYWYYPVSQSLGAALYRAGRYADASEAFRTALAQTPGNGWALYGLAESERVRGHAFQAAATRKALDRAWIGDRALLRMDRL